MKLEVLLLNLGGPSHLGEVRSFLFDLFSDPDVIPVPFSKWLQKPTAYSIALCRQRISKAYYRAIGGSSPLKRITEEQGAALEERLKKRFSDAKVYIAMRYGHPSIKAVWHALRRDEMTDLIILPLYPQYSMATTGSSYKVLREVMQNMRSSIQRVVWIESWHDHPIYIDSWVENIKTGIRHLPEIYQNDFDLIFSAHSLPLKFIKEGDPYDKQIRTTVALVVEKLGTVPAWHLSYQSKTGPIAWLEPSTSDLLKNLAQSRRRAILMVPISFVSDHVETLYEIDILYKGEAEKLGFPYFARVSSLNLSEKFIDALEDLVLKHTLSSDA